LKDWIQEMELQLEQKKQPSWANTMEHYTYDEEFNTAAATMHQALAAEVHSPRALAD
jgi:hypothetical protein